MTLKTIIPNHNPNLYCVEIWGDDLMLYPIIAWRIESHIPPRPTYQGQVTIFDYPITVTNDDVENDGDNRVIFDNATKMWFCAVLQAGFGETKLKEFLLENFPNHG